VTNAAAPDHREWAELTVAYAVGALEQADADVAAAHVAGCDECRLLTVETRTTLADLAASVPPVEPPAALRASVLAAARTEEPEAVPPVAADGADAVDVRPLRRRRPTWLPASPLAVAAAVVLLLAVAAGVWTLVGRTGGGGSIAQRCARVDCPTVALVSHGQPVADAMVLDGVVYVRARALASNDPARNEYVLWRIRPGAPPAAVGGFDVPKRGATVRVARLGVPLAQVAVFAITEEPGRTPPAAPGSAPLAAGSVS
jgi:anti-sigma-K factor RskA